jgi:uncharacterized repeat protein (TIGR04138 family)
MLVSVLINCDLFCSECEYNLRGLRSDGICPECGHAIKATLETVPPGEIPGLDDLVDAIRRERYAPIATSTGYSVDAVMFVYDVWRYAAQTGTMGGKVVSRQVTAIDICNAAREHARFYFNDQAEAKELLNEWGIRTGQDIGRIILGMAQAGWLEAKSGDSVSQFAGLFTLATIFDQPG